MDFSIATPKGCKSPDDDQTDRIPYTLIGIFVEGVTYGLASVDTRWKGSYLTTATGGNVGSTPP